MVVRDEAERKRHCALALSLALFGTKSDLALSITDFSTNVAKCRHWTGRRVSDMPNESKESQRFRDHGDDRLCLKDPGLDGDFGWKVDDGVEELNRPSSDVEIRSLRDVPLVSHGTSMNGVVSDWCDVLSFNLSSVTIVT